MKKIPTLFKRIFDERHRKHITSEITPGLEWVLDGRGVATVKIDGTCCAVIDGRFYRRYDAKQGKMPPPGAVPCCDPDPVTGHWPHWLECDFRDTADNWHLAAFFNAGGFNLKCGTYEAIGPHFQNNPYRLTHDILVRHGSEVIRDCPRSFGGLRDYLESHPIEGIVFWIDGEPMCKIKRSDFGFRWPCENAQLSAMS